MNQPNDPLDSTLGREIDVRHLIERTGPMFQHILYHNLSPRESMLIWDAAAGVRDSSLSPAVLLRQVDGMHYEGALEFVRERIAPHDPVQRARRTFYRACAHLGFEILDLCYDPRFQTLDPMHYCALLDWLGQVGSPEEVAAYLQAHFPNLEHDGSDPELLEAVDSLLSTVSLSLEYVPEEERAHDDDERFHHRNARTMRAIYDNLSLDERHNWNRYIADLDDSAFTQLVTRLDGASPEFCLNEARSRLQQWSGLSGWMLAKELERDGGPSRQSVRDELWALTPEQLGAKYAAYGHVDPHTARRIGLYPLWTYPDSAEG